MSVLSLPDDIMLEVFSYLSIHTTLAMATVCKQWRAISAQTVATHSRHLSKYLNHTVDLYSLSNHIMQTTKSLCSYELEHGIGLGENCFVSNEECVCYVISPNKLGYIGFDGHKEISIRSTVDGLICAPTKHRPVTIGTCEIEDMPYEYAWFILCSDGQEHVWTETQIGRIIYSGRESGATLWDFEIQTLIPDVGAASVCVIYNATLKDDAGLLQGPDWYTVNLPIQPLSDVDVCPMPLKWVPHWHILPMFYGRRTLLLRYSNRDRMVEFRHSERVESVVHGDCSTFYTRTTFDSIPTEVLAISRGRFIIWSAKRAIVVGADGQNELVLPDFKESSIIDIVCCECFVIVVRGVNGVAASRLDAIYCCPVGSMLMFATQTLPMEVTEMAVLGRTLCVHSFTAHSNVIKCFHL